MDTIATPPTSAVPPEPILRLSVEQYHGLLAAGILDDDTPVELLEGWMVQKMPRNPQHVLVTRRLRDWLESFETENWHVRTQEPITLEDSEPEPDLAVVLGRADEYSTLHPSGPEVLMVVEVADTTLARDRGLKKRAYARAGIPVYWIVDLNSREIEVNFDPNAQGDYQHRESHRDRVQLILKGDVLGELELKEDLFR